MATPTESNLHVPDAKELGFDPDDLRERYRVERDRRLRPDGEDQYATVSGELEHYGRDDPYAPKGFSREPIRAEVEIVIVGGGFSGMLAAARLHEAGIENVVIIEAAADFGGTWYWNRYPGAQCDIESYCYLPLLEELDYMPKEKYSFAPEIYQHCQRIGKAYGLYDDALFQTRVTDLRWDDDSKRWSVATDRDDDLKARFVVMAIGPASRPKLPAIPGVTDFEGHSFHTSRWDYDYTGGDHGGNLTKLADKRVAIIGTGATAIQCVPSLGAHALTLYVFQRTPSSVDLRGNKLTDPDWWKSLGPGWQRARRDNFNAVFAGLPFEEDLVNDGWTEIFRELMSIMRGPAAAGALAQPGGMEKVMQLGEIADFRKMNGIRERVEAIVEDPRTAGTLKPWYRQFCKRPTFNDEYLETFNRPNVTLVDTADSHGVERITKRGLVANGIEYEVDCIVYATGFEIGTAFNRQLDFDIIGQDGASLVEQWTHEMRTLHGHSSHGFPNWFFVGTTQNALSVNFTAMYDEQARHIAYIIKETRDRGASTVQPTAEAQEAWADEVMGLAMNARDFMESCTPGYYNSEGRIDQNRESKRMIYAPGIVPFNQILAGWREAGDLAGMELEK